MCVDKIQIWVIWYINQAKYLLSYTLQSHYVWGWGMEFSNKSTRKKKRVQSFFLVWVEFHVLRKDPQSWQAAYKCKFPYPGVFNSSTQHGHYANFIITIQYNGFSGKLPSKLSLVNELSKANLAVDMQGRLGVLWLNSKFAWLYNS